MMTVRCRRCGHTVPNYASFCPTCGSSSSFFEWESGNAYRNGAENQAQGRSGRTQVLDQNDWTVGNLSPYIQMVGSGEAHDRSTSERTIAYHTTEYGTAQPYIIIGNEERNGGSPNPGSNHNPVGYDADYSGKTVDLENLNYTGGIQYGNQSIEGRIRGESFAQNKSGYKPSTGKLYRDKQEEWEDYRKKDKEIRAKKRKAHWNNTKQDAAEIISTTAGIHSFLGQLLLVVVWFLFLGITMAYITGLVRVIEIGGIDLSIDIKASYKEMFLLGIICVIVLAFIPGRLTVGILKINAEIPSALILMLCAAFVSLFFELFYPISDFRLTAVAASIGTLLGLSFFQPSYKKPGIKRLLWACFLIVLLSVLLGITGLSQLRYLWEIVLKSFETISTDDIGAIL